MDGIYVQPIQTIELVMYYGEFSEPEGWLVLGFLMDIFP